MSRRRTTHLPEHCLDRHRVLIDILPALKREAFSLILREKFLSGGGISGVLAGECLEIRSLAIRHSTGGREEALQLRLLQRRDGERLHRVVVDVLRDTVVDDEIVGVHLTLTEFPKPTPQHVTKAPKKRAQTQVASVDR